MPSAKKTLPPCDRICANNRTVAQSLAWLIRITLIRGKCSLWCREIETLVLRGATIFVNQLKTVLWRNFIEVRLGIILAFELKKVLERSVYLVMGRRQTLSKALPDGRETIEGLIPRSPKRVTPCIFWGLNDFQNCIVWGNSFERDALWKSVSEIWSLVAVAYSACHPSLATLFGPINLFWYSFLAC